MTPHRVPPPPRAEKLSTLELLAEVIGESAAVRLSVRYGGRRLYIPKEPAPAGDFVGAIGYKNALLLAARYGGTHMEMPLERGKRERIVMFSKRGLTVSAIAEVVGCTERHVKQVRAEYRANGNQLSRIDEHADPAQANLFEEVR